MTDHNEALQELKESITDQFTSKLNERVEQIHEEKYAPDTEDNENTDDDDVDNENVDDENTDEQDDE